MKKPKLATEPKPPQITFDEAEVKKVAAFINFVYQKATFTMNSKESQEYSMMLNHMHQHVQKCNDHIMELLETSKRSD